VKHYFDLLHAAAAHLRANNAHYRALSIIKICGLNLHTHENRLINDTTAHLANWATNGQYTPSALYAFYDQQTALLASEFPNKDMSYALIQAGFPLINDYGEYAGQTAPTNHPLPKGTEQTEIVMFRGRTNYGLRFVVQHNGLQAKPVVSCPCEGVHPNTCGNLAQAPPGCPNRWVIQQGQAGQVTGFQTVNELTNLTLLESAISNEWDNTDGIFLEVYQANALSAITANFPSGRALGDWNELFHQRRRGQGVWTNLAEPFPLTFRHTFVHTATNTSAPQLFYYLDPAKCHANGRTIYGIVAVHPTFSFTSVLKANSQIVVTLGVANPGTNWIETSTTLTNWNTVVTGVTNTGFLNFTAAAPNAPMRFYRAVRRGP
jgi:hypothetical protein